MLIIACTLFLLVHKTVVGRDYCADHIRFAPGSSQCDELSKLLGDSIEDLNNMCSSKKVRKACQWTCNTCPIRDNRIKKMSVRFQNRLRKLHSADELSWKDDLAISAEQECRKMAGLDWNPDLLGAHAGSNTFHGLNIRQMGRIPGFAIRHWYNQRDLFNFTTSEYVEEAAEFTRMIWKSVKNVGCGYAKFQEYGKDSGVVNHIYFCCHYYPAGNILNKFSENVEDTKAGK